MATQAIIKGLNGKLHIQYFGTTPNGSQTYENEQSSPHKLSSDLSAIRTISSNANVGGTPYLDIKIASSAILFYYSKDTVIIDHDNSVLLDTSDETKTFADFEIAAREFLGYGTFPTLP